jgi:hypothetical protein
MDSTPLKKSAAAAGIGVALCLFTGVGSASAAPAPTPSETSTWVVENGVPHRVPVAPPSPNLEDQRWQAQADHYGKAKSAPAPAPKQPVGRVVDSPSRLPDWVFPALGTTAAIALVAGAATTIQRRQQRPA